MRIFYNGTVYTGTGFVRAFAVEGGKFAAVKDDYCVFQTLPWKTVNEVYTKKKSKG